MSETKITLHRNECLVESAEQIFDWFVFDGDDIEMIYRSVVLGDC